MPAPPPVTPDDLVARSHPSKTAGLHLPYRLYVPRDYVQSKRYPLLTVLHGAGERGADNERHLANGVLAFCDPALQRRHPTFVVYPQCPEKSRWVESDWATGSYELDRVAESAPLMALRELLVSLAQEFTLDPGARLLAGLSMGAYGTFDLLGRHPGMFSGAMAICGGGDPAKAPLMKDVAVWVFHGAADDVVPVAGSRQMVQALRRAGARVRYTEYPGVKHRSWEKAFADRRALSWLLSRRRAATALDGKAARQ